MRNIQTTSTVDRKENRLELKPVMTALRCYGNPDVDRIPCIRNFDLTSSKSDDINLLYYVSVRCGLKSVTVSVTIEKSDQATLKRPVNKYSSLCTY